jgi:hypothetical protein
MRTIRNVHQDDQNERIKFNLWNWLKQPDQSIEHHSLDRLMGREEEITG